MELHLCLVTVITFILLQPEVVLGHGRLVEPASRNAMWRFKYSNPRNYNDMGLNCGGFTTQFEKYGGRCGVCGDPYAGAREHEAGGKYANGIIARQYKVGSFINVTVTLTSNHMGFFEFRLCPVNNPRVKVTQACLDQHLLNIVGHGTRYFIMDKRGYIKIGLFVMLPPKLQCSQCVFQWKYVAGQSMGPDGRGGECLGCGNQEHFVNCADIAIGSKVIAPLPQAVTTPGPPVTKSPYKPNNLNIVSVNMPPHQGNQQVHSYSSYSHASHSNMANHNAMPHAQMQHVQASVMTSPAPYIAPKVPPPTQINGQWGGTVQGWQTNQANPQTAYQASGGVQASKPQVQANGYPSAPQYQPTNRHAHQAPSYQPQNSHAHQAPSYNQQVYPQQSNPRPPVQGYQQVNNAATQVHAYPQQHSNVPQPQAYNTGTNQAPQPQIYNAASKVPQTKAYRQVISRTPQRHSSPQTSRQAQVQPYSQQSQPQSYPQTYIQKVPTYPQPTYSQPQQNKPVPQAPTLNQPISQQASQSSNMFGNLKPAVLKQMFPNLMEGFDWMAEMTQQTPSANNQNQQDPTQRLYPGYEAGEYPEPGEVGPTNTPTQSSGSSGGQSTYQQGYNDAMRELKAKYGINIPQIQTSQSGGSAPKRCPDGVTKPTCRGTNAWQGKPQFDAWCTQTCTSGECPANFCMCSCPGTGSWKSGVTCKGIDPAKGSSMDNWCTLNCKGGNCPSDLCACF